MRISDWSSDVCSSDLTLGYAMNTLKIPALSNHWIGNSGPDGRPWNVAAVTAWLCSDLSENLNGRELYINGGHVALVQEPECVRSQFAVAGWTFEGLCDEGTTRAHTWDIRKNGREMGRDGVWQSG